LEKEVKARKYRKRKGRRFDLRKDHTLNEKKKRRASAQKANAIMQNEEEQPLMADKSIKSQDNAPMEEVEVNHEDANTAIMQEDDQGSEYNIDEYLDVTSKHSLFVIHYSY
jgi:hypothetical protein